MNSNNKTLNECIRSFLLYKNFKPIFVANWGLISTTPGNKLQGDSELICRHRACSSHWHVLNKSKDIISGIKLIVLSILQWTSFLEILHLKDSTFRLTTFFYSRSRQTAAYPTGDWKKFNFLARSRVLNYENSL